MAIAADSNVQLRADLGLSFKRGSLLQSRGYPFVESLEVMIHHSRCSPVKELLRLLKNEFMTDFSIRKTVAAHKKILGQTVGQILEIGFVGALISEALAEAADLCFMEVFPDLEVGYDVEDLGLFYFLKRTSALTKFGVPINEARLAAKADSTIEGLENTVDQILKSAAETNMGEDLIIDKVYDLSEKLGFAKKFGFSRPENNEEADFRFQRYVFYRRVLDEIFEGKNLRAAIKVILEETDEPRLAKAIRWLLDQSPPFGIYEAMALHTEDIFTWEEVAFVEMAERSESPLDAVQALLEIIKFEFQYGYFYFEPLSEQTARPKSSGLRIVK